MGKNKECPLIGRCEFAKRKNSVLQTISRKDKIKEIHKDYCFNEDETFRSCARYQVSKKMAIEKIPIVIFPWDHRFVKEIG